MLYARFSRLRVRVACVLLLANADQRHGEHLTMYVIYGRRQLIRDAAYFLTIGVAYGLVFFYGFSS